MLTTAVTNGHLEKQLSIDSVPGSIVTEEVVYIILLEDLVDLIGSRWTGQLTSLTVGLLMMFLARLAYCSVLSVSP